LEQLPPPPACLDSLRTVIVTDPRGVQARHVFGNRWRVNEGQLLQLDEGWNGSTALRTTSSRHRLPAGQAYPEQFGTLLTECNDHLSARHRPQDRRVTTVQGSKFTWQVDESAAGFDALARPLRVRRFSSLGHDRTDVTGYADNRSLWVMGQLASLTEAATGLQVERHDYDPVSATWRASHAFGKLQEAFTYHTDGTLASVSDPAGRLTALARDRRGKPQQLGHPDGTSESQVVDNLGNIKPRINAAGTTSTYDHDAMGRIRTVVHPNEPGLAYHPATITFEQIAFDELGLAAGHWRQTVASGNARTVRYFDALWRERILKRFDAANPALTTGVVETRHDADGRKTFSSYPQRSLAAVDLGSTTGTAWEHDALGRPWRQVQHSELGPLTTTTEWPAVTLSAGS
jgi:hypothetical protein